MLRTIDWAIMVVYFVFVLNTTPHASSLLEQGVQSRLRNGLINLRFRATGGNASEDLSVSDNWQTTLVGEKAPGKAWPAARPVDW
jgi:hypothetical protein